MADMDPTKTMADYEAVVMRVLAKVADDPSYVPVGDEADEYIEACQISFAVAMYQQGVDIDSIEKLMENLPEITVSLRSTPDGGTELSYTFAKEEES